MMRRITPKKGFVRLEWHALKGWWGSAGQRRMLYMITVSAREGLDVKMVTPYKGTPLL